MPDGVLPALAVVPVVREVLYDEAVDAAEREALLGRRRDGHGYESDVRVGRLLWSRVEHICEW